MGEPAKQARVRARPRNGAIGKQVSAISQPSLSATPNGIVTEACVPERREFESGRVRPSIGVRLPAIRRK